MTIDAAAALTRRYPRPGDGIHVVSSTDLASDQQVSIISTVSTIGWLEVIETDTYIQKYRERKTFRKRRNGGYLVDTSRSERYR